MPMESNAAVQDRDKARKAVRDRAETEHATVSVATYNLVIGLVLCWGFLVNWLLVHYIDPARVVGIDIRLFFLGYFGSCLYGAYLFNKSKEPAISFIGYNLVVVPFGFVLNIVVHRYDPDLVLQAIQLTASVTIMMMVAGSLAPEFFRNIQSSITMALLCVIVVEIIQIYVLSMHSDWIDWAVAILFCGYIGYDWGRANRLPKTVDNAIDSAAEIYMDVINLFVRILRIMGRKK